MGEKKDAYDTRSVSTVIISGGHAGLTMSYALGQLRLEPVVLRMWRYEFSRISFGIRWLYKRKSHFMLKGGSR